MVRMNNTEREKKEVEAAKKKANLKHELPEYLKMEGIDFSFCYYRW